MARKDHLYRTIRTIEGIVFHLYEDDKGVIRPHSTKGPAVEYPKSEAKPDEYFIFGIKYDYDKWLELSRPFRRALTVDKEDLVD
jgi:hypothetical protein